jgi:DNA polymerase-3 subunit chi
MSEAIFYELLDKPWNKVFPKVIESIVNRGNKIHILAEEKMVPLIDDLLWSFEQLSFLPHATCRDAELDVQPIVISHNIAKRNDANVLALVNTALPEEYNLFDKIICVYEQGNKESIKILAQQLLSNGAAIQCYAQTSDGGWKRQEGV